LQSSQLVFCISEFVVLLFSLSVHESAHAWVASRLGDQTARMLGRVSLNPMDHIDPIGTLLIPAIGIFGPLFGLGYLGGFIFGWAKPVPIVSRNFRNFRRDDTLVSLAGPASNLLLALLAFAALAAIAIATPHGHRDVIVAFLYADGQDVGIAPQPVAFLCSMMVLLNLILCIFNLIPIPPLDGSHILRHVLPYNAAQVFDRITGIASYFLIIIAGRAILGFLLPPVLGLFYSALGRI
jgi:Zn-dependent protease